MSKRPPELAAGGVLWQRKNDNVRILLAHRPRYDDWAFPKGRLDRGENLMQCAIREVIEETGISFSLGQRLPDVAYAKPSGRAKRVAYWAMRHDGGKFVPNREVDQAVWVTPRKALKMLTYDRDREIVEALDGAWRKDARRVILVRHGHADTRGTAGKDDRRRALSEIGKTQAKALVPMLEGHRVDAIVSSPAKRCVQTMKPLARALDLDIESVDDLWEESKPKRFRQHLINTERSTIVVCTHRPIVKDLLAKRVRPFFSDSGQDHGKLATEDLPYEKGAVWVIDYTSAGELTDAHYHRPTT